jgi:hypothetical protein
MSKLIMLFITAMVLFSCSQDTRLFLFHHGQIRYPLPTAEQLKNDYLTNKPVLDSLVKYCNLLYDSKPVKASCLLWFEIYMNKGKLAFYPEREIDKACTITDSAAFKDYYLDKLLENADVKLLFNKISFFYTKAVIPKNGRISLAGDRIAVPRMLALADYKDNHYISFFYLRNVSAKKMFSSEDSLAVSCFTNRSEFVLH